MRLAPRFARLDPARRARTAVALVALVPLVVSGACRAGGDAADEASTAPAARLDGPAAPVTDSAGAGTTELDSTDSTDVADPLAERRLEAPVLGASTSADGMTLEVYAFAADRNAAAGTLEAIVDEDGATAAPAGSDTGAVRLLIRQRPVQAAAASSFVCRLDHAAHVVRVQLRAPLGSRVLLDEATGVRVVPIDDATIRRPSGLPTGWALQEERPLREADRVTGWAQRYGAGDSGAPITVTQRYSSLGPDERYSVDRVDVEAVTVRGAAGVFSRQANWDAAALAWPEGRWTITVSSSSPDGAVPAVDRATLEAFAASLTSPDPS